MDAATVIAEHKRIVLFFSGGRDSLALLLLLRPFWDRMTIAWANPGAPHQETIDYMRGVQALVPYFVELTGAQPEWIAAHGWPVDVLPVRATRDGENGAGPVRMRFQSYMTCCWANMWGPMFEYVRSNAITLVIMGQRKEEPLRNRGRDEEIQEIEGVTYLQPLNDWTSSQVEDFIREKGESMPPFYADGAQSSADCWNCTAYLDQNRGRIAHLKHADPERHRVIAQVLETLSNTVWDELNPLYRILQE